MAHVLRNIKDHIIDQPLVARAYPRRLLEAFKEAVVLHGNFTASRVTAEANARLHRGLLWHHERGNLLRVLEDPSIPATNNEAERSLRPAVIARKVSHCSGSDRGVESHSVFSSFFCTMKRRGVDSAIDGILGLLLGRPMHEPAAI